MNVRSILTKHVFDDALTFLFQRRHAPRILRSIDSNAYHEIFRAHQEAAIENEKMKYLAIDEGVNAALRFLRRAQLHRTPPSSVLDIGTGSGFFPHACRHFGHEAMGTDKAIDDFPSPAARQLDSMYLNLNELMNIERVRWTIHEFEPAPLFNKKFDVITAFSTWFDFDDDGELRWDEVPWKFFLTDLANNLLTARGQIHIKLNNHHKNIAQNDERRERVLKFVTETGGVVTRTRRPNARTQYWFSYPTVQALRALK